MSQVWTITSGKGGVGKTMLTAAMAMSLARRHLETAVVDADAGLRGMDILYGLQSRVVFDMADVAEGACKVKQAMVRHAKAESLALLSASQSGTCDDLDDNDVRRVVKKLRKNAAYVLIDCPAGIGRGFRQSIAAADHVLLVTTPDDVALRDAERVLSLLDARGLPRASVVVNRVQPKMVRAGDMLAPSVIAATLDAPLLGYIPEDNAVCRALLRHETAIEERGAAQAAIERIVRRFLGEYVPIPPLATRRRLFGRKEASFAP